MSRSSRRTAGVRRTAGLRRAAGVAVLAAALLGTGAAPTAGGEPAGRADLLPPCPPVPTGSPESGPPLEPELGPGPGLPPGPGACRARATRVEPAGAGRLPVPRPGYHHLGATTAGEWSGMVGRLTVRDPGVRAGSFDFVATRFLARQAPVGGDRLAWLEVGWAETGWSDQSGPTGYVFDSESMSWAFFDGYPLRDGERVWVSLRRDPDAGAGPAAWSAWLWWGGRWRLLAAADLPGAGPAWLEQYVEVHHDPGAAGPPVTVPTVRVDQVRVAAGVTGGGGSLRAWRPDRVPTLAPGTSSGYCLSWEQRYDAWSAGDCAHSDRAQ